MLLFDTKQYNKIIELIPTLDKKFEKDSEIQLIFALSLEKSNRVQESDERLIKLSSHFKNNADITLRTTQAYVRRKEPENALLVINTFLNNSPRKPNNFIFYFLKSQIHVQLNQLQEALSNINLCIEMHPRFEKGWLLYATLHEQQGEIQKALQGYGTFLELVDGNNSIEKHLFSLMLKHKTDTQIAPFHKTYFDLAVKSYTKKEYRAALTSINKYLELHNNNYEALMLKMQILAMINDYPHITHLVAEQLKQNPQTHELWAKSMYLLHHHNVPKSNIISLLKTFTQTYSDHYWYLLYAADLYLRLNKSTEAIGLLEAVLQKSCDTHLNTKVHYQLGLLHYDLNNYTDMLSHLEKGYALNNNCSQLNNMLAYYWATKGKDLQKAISYFNKIDMTHEKNSCFLDTQALILYKQHEYTQAQTILESLENNNNATMLLHLAKTYHKTDNTKKAFEMTKKATPYVANNREEKTLKRLKKLLSAHG